MKKAIVSVTNDLYTDRRVDKSCKTLQKLGYEVTLIGRRKKDSAQLEKRAYKTHRMKLIFEKGHFFYIEYNFRLYLYLLFHKVDLLFSNDLDTLLANFLISKIKKSKLVYDTHEYYTEVPELEGREVVKKVWKSIESFIFPKLKHVITVNDSIAKTYSKEYGNSIHVVRNIPPSGKVQSHKTKQELGIPEEKKIILLQGAGINIDRGAEELLESMTMIDDAALLIVGGGDIIDDLKARALKDDLKEKVIFFPKQPIDKLQNITIHADLGISFNKGTNLNYVYSLPNKLFEYIQAGVPVLASDMVEMKKIIKTYDVGICIDDHSPENIASHINNLFSNKDRLLQMKLNTTKAKEELNWEKEEKKLLACLNF